MRFSKVLTHAALASSSFLVAFVAIEICLRAFGVSFPSFYKVDQIRGYQLRANTQGLWKREGNGNVSINSSGFRGPEFTKTKPKSTFRIAVLGDSFTESLQVNHDQTWIKLLENQLLKDQCLDPKLYENLEVMNFGVGGYGTGQALLTWEHHAIDFSPNMVLLAFYPGNDFEDNEYKPRHDRPQFFIDQSGKLAIDNSFRDTQGFKFKTSFMGSLLNEMVNRLRFLQLLNEAKNRLQISSTRRESNASQSSSRPMLNSPTETSYLLTSRIIQKLSKSVKQRNASFAVVSVSLPEIYYQAEGKPNLSGPSFRQVHSISTILARNHIFHMPLAYKFALEWSHTGKSKHGFGDALGDGHWNVAGHQFAAEMLSKEVCALIRQ